MRWSVDSLATAIGGEVLGDGSRVIDALDALDDAKSNSISPFFKKRHLEKAPLMPAAVLTTGELAPFALAAGVAGALVHKTPVVALAALIDRFYPEAPQAPEIHPTAVIHPTAILHPTVSVGPSVVIEADVSIGEASVIGPGAVICAGTVMGQRVRIGPGAVIGHEGFGFVPTGHKPLKIRQVGKVIIEDDVEIGANACVDRATLGATVIGAGSKLDNLVQVGHNGRIGRGVLIAGQAGLAGSVSVGDHALIGGNAGIADHLTIGASAKVAAKSGVIGDIEAGAVVAGYPAMARHRWLRNIAALGRVGKKK